MKKKPNFEEISAKVKKIIKKQRLKPEVVEEAIQWARKQKGIRSDRAPLNKPKTK
jgi:hypothetical protein